MEKNIFQFKRLKNTFHKNLKTKVVQYLIILIYIILQNIILLNNINYKYINIGNNILWYINIKYKGILISYISAYNALI